MHELSLLQNIEKSQNTNNMHKKECISEPQNTNKTSEKEKILTSAR